MSLDAKGDAVFEVAEYERKRLRRFTVFMGVFLVLGLLIASAQFYLLGNIAVSNRRVLTSEIPALKEQITARDKTITTQQRILQEQAIPAIVKLSNQVRSLGGTPAPVVLEPPKEGS